MNRTLTLATLLALLLASSTARAEDPPNDKGPAYQQAPAVPDGERTLFASANTAGLLLWDPDGAGGGAAIPLCIPFRSMVQLRSKGGEAIYHPTMGQTTDYPTAVDATGACYVTDADVPGTNGKGACITTAAGERRTVVIDFAEVYSAPGARGAMCSGSIEGLGRTMVRPPCFDAADCTASGAGGTCDTASVVQLRGQSCAFVVVQVDTDDTLVTINSTK